MENENKEQGTFEITLFYSESDVSSELIKDLARELKERGHSVSLKKSIGLDAVKEFTKQAKEIADSAKEIAQFGIQRLREAIGTKTKSTEEGFDEIGSAGNNDAIIVTDVEFLADLNPAVMRIGLMPQTKLDKTWLPHGLDAMVIPHEAFRAYLSKVEWDMERVFVGGFLALESAKRSDSAENLRTKFKVSPDNGPVLLVLANSFSSDQLPTLFIQLSLLKTPYQAIFYHAGEPAIANQLRQLADRFHIQARMFGLVSPLSDYLGLAHVAVATNTAQDLALIESLGIPCVCIENPGPQPLAEFLKHEGAALLAPQLYQLSKQLQPLLSDAEILAQVGAQAQHIASYASTKRCADAIEEALRKRPQIMTDPDRQRYAQNPQGGFEVIGSVPSLSGSAPQEQMATPQSNNDLQPIVAAVRDNPILSPTLSKQSGQSVHAELTQLILLEKALDKQLDAASDDVRKWELRLDLAKNRSDDKLTAQAQTALEAAKAQEIGLFQQKDQIARQKDQLKQVASKAPKPAAQGGGLADFLDAPEVDETEKKFQELQRQQQLQMLRDRMKRGY